MRRVFALCVLFWSACTVEPKLIPCTAIEMHPDADADGYGDPTTVVWACPGEGPVIDATDCDDTTADANPERAERCDGIDNDCDGDVDGGAYDAEPYFRDADNDGFGDVFDRRTSCSAPDGYVTSNDDCDDRRADVYPGAPEDCANPLDANCDGRSEYGDLDLDGSPTCLDCDDADPQVFPDAPERCNRIDDDCDGTVDEGDAVDASEWYLDVDGDGAGNHPATIRCQAPAGYVDNLSDCDDTDAQISPWALERCNAFDDDCDGVVDEADAVDAPTWFTDTDQDGAGALPTARSCHPTAFLAPWEDDCDDTDPLVHPAAPEACDGVDNNCDGRIDEDGATSAATWFWDGDGDGFGDPMRPVVSCEAPVGAVDNADDCDDGDPTMHPDTVWYLDEDGDGFGGANERRGCTSPAGHSPLTDDCDDLDPDRHPAHAERCDGVDNDCDGLLLPSELDEDGDGALACDDCDDLRADVSPELDERCDAIDNDCDGFVDESGALDEHTFFVDADGDGFGDPNSPVMSCTRPAGAVDDGTDCDDALADAHTTTTWFHDLDGDGYGAAPLQHCGPPPTPHSARDGDCDDGTYEVHPAAPEACDQRDDDCNGIIDDGEALGAGAACAASHCAHIRDAHPNPTNSIAWISPLGDAPFQIWCDQETDGGGWNVVWSNHGGFHGGEESNADLISRMLAGQGDDVVLPHDVELVSSMHAQTDIWWNARFREWLKRTTLWEASTQGNDPVHDEAHIRVEMNGVTMADVFATPAGDRCHQAPDTMHVWVNDTVDFGQTDRLSSYSPNGTTFGLANAGHPLFGDDCGQPIDNVIHDPGDTLFRLDAGSLNGIRHLFSYVHTASGEDASRCLYSCWTSASASRYYDGFTWAVR